MYMYMYMCTRTYVDAHHTIVQTIISSHMLQYTRTNICEWKPYTVLTHTQTHTIHTYTT